MDPSSLGALTGDDPVAGVVLLDEDAECVVVAGGVIEIDPADGVGSVTPVVDLVQKFLKPFQIDTNRNRRRVGWRRLPLPPSMAASSVQPLSSSLFVRH